MNRDQPAQPRRQFLQWLAGLGAAAALGPGFAAPGQAAIRKAIPASGEKIPVIGMGSWLTFDVGDDQAARATRVQVLQAFFDRGGALIDSSPMYGSSQEVIGHCLRKIRNKGALFAATKVWIYGQWLGVKQMQAARELWGVARFDLMQIHNMLDWRAHLETLKAWKAEGRIRYIGITTSHGRRHPDLERALAKEPFDFVQFTYNLEDREAEQRLLPLALKIQQFGKMAQCAHLSQSVLTSLTKAEHLTEGLNSGRDVSQHRLRLSQVVQRRTAHHVRVPLLQQIESLHRQFHRRSDFAPGEGKIGAKAEHDAAIGRRRINRHKADGQVGVGFGHFELACDHQRPSFRQGKLMPLAHDFIRHDFKPATQGRNLPVLDDLRGCHPDQKG